MSITLEVNGQQYTQFKSASVQLRLDALTNTFGFEATSEDGNPLPFRGGEACKINVDGELILTGVIEIVSVSYSSTSHNISISGRDKTGDLLDSTLDAISDLIAPITLKQIIERVISQLGLDIEVLDNVNPEPFNAAEDIISPEPGENAFEFIEKYSRKRQVLLTSNGDGNIVITQSSSDFIESRIRMQIDSNANNVLSASVSYDQTGRYNVYKFASSLNPIAINAAGVVDNESIVDQQGQEIDSEIRKGRQLILISENPYSNDQNNDRAIWEANIRKSRGRVYSAAVDGFRNEEADLWQLNKLVSVIDEFAGINARMLSNTIDFNFDLNSGSTTTIGFVEENAYKLTLEEPRTENLGVGLA